MIKASTRVIFAFFVFANALVGCEKASEKANAANPPVSNQSNIQAPTTQADAAPDKVVVYYFHFTRRCRTCLGIQATIEKTIRERFGAETASGALTFQDVNLDLPENGHFTTDYRLGFSSMVVVAKKGQTTLKWENCDKVWELAHNEPALTEYTEKSIRAYVDKLKRS